jgi:hypothetical protein
LKFGHGLLNGGVHSRIKLGLLGLFFCGIVCRAELPAKFFWKFEAKPFHVRSRVFAGKFFVKRVWIFF